MKVVIAINTYIGSPRLLKFLDYHKKIFDKLGYDYYLIVGDETINDDGNGYLLGEDYWCDTDLKLKFFYAKCYERYENLAHKLGIFYKYVSENDKYDMVIKLDDGCKVKNINMIRNIPRYDYLGALMTPTINKCHYKKCTDKKLNKMPLDFSHNLCSRINNHQSIANLIQEKRKKTKSKFSLFELLKETKEIKKKGTIRKRELMKIKYGGGGYGYILSKKSLKWAKTIIFFEEKAEYLRKFNLFLE